MDDYWTACTAAVSAVRAARPQTAAEVIAILRATDPHVPDAETDAFWSAANAGDSLFDLLDAAGWRLTWYEAEYHWQMTPPTPGDALTYVEGDVYATPAGTPAPADA